VVFFLFDLLYLDGEDVSARPLIERKARLAALLSNASSPPHYSDHQRGQGRAFHEKACAMSLEGIVSKRADAAYAPGNRGLWVKVKCLHREEFVVVGWTDPEGSRPWLGALLLAYYDPDGRLVYAGARRRRHQAGGAGTPVPPPAAARDLGDAARGPAAAQHPLRFAAGA
jgi:ATP-dependent DNA ligase